VAGIDRTYEGQQTSPFFVRGAAPNQATRRRDTPGEIALRAELRALGLRYRVDVPLPGTRRRADVAFLREKVAVFVDGCWHGAPNGTWPKANASWWRSKIETNQRRDRTLIWYERQVGRCCGSGSMLTQPSPHEM
jgi:DNA mismatch endonuclease Vsr